MRSFPHPPHPLSSSPRFALPSRLRGERSEGGEARRLLFPHSEGESAARGIWIEGWRTVS